MWRADLARLRNPHRLAPLALPATVKLFSEIPVVLGASVSKVSGHPTDVEARLYTAELAAAAEAAAAAAKAEAGAEARGEGAGEEEPEALSEAEEERGSLHLGVLIDTAMYDD